MTDNIRKMMTLVKEGVQPIDPKKIKSLSDKLYKDVKAADKLTHTGDRYDKKKMAAGEKIIHKLEKQADKVLKGQTVRYDRSMWIVDSVEYSTHGGDWWVYASELNDPSGNSDNFLLIDLY